MRKMPRNGAIRLSKNVKCLPSAVPIVTVTKTTPILETPIISIIHATTTAPTFLDSIVGCSNNNKDNCLNSDCVERIKDQIVSFEKCKSDFINPKSQNYKNIVNKEVEEEENELKQTSSFHNSQNCSLIDCAEDKQKFQENKKTSNICNIRETLTTTTTIGVTSTATATTSATRKIQNHLCDDNKSSTTLEETTITTIISNIGEISTTNSNLRHCTDIIKPIGLGAETTATSSSKIENNIKEANNNNNKHSQCHSNTLLSIAQINCAIDCDIKKKQEKQQEQKEEQKSVQQHHQHQEQSKQLPLINTENTISKKRKLGRSSYIITVPNKEVCERLASLRKRKIVNAVTRAITSKENAKQRQEKSNLKSKQFSKKSESEQQQQQQQQQSVLTPKLVKSGSIFNDDIGDLNRIEHLKEHDVKRSNTKRKRNHSTVILKTAINTNRRRKRKSNVNTNTNTSTNNNNNCGKVEDNNNNNNNNKKEEETVTGASTSILTSNSLNIATSKKRPKDMSLYDNRYQTAANDGRSLVGNGYLTTARATGSNSNSILLNDLNDGQDMANQYYLSNTGPSINGSSNTFIGSNGSNSGSGIGNCGSTAVNHAPSMAALCNIGNSCYLNSVVYTLRFAPQFLHNLHHLVTDLNAVQQNIARARSKSSSLGRGINSSHMESARSWSSKDLASMEQYNIGGGNGSSSGNGISVSSLKENLIQKNSHQLLAEKLHELYQSLYRNEITESTEPHHADTLLRAIQDVSTIFEGNQQQDAHEFLMCILNSIRETSQTLIKAIAECPDIILNGYISNPDEINSEERDASNAKHSNTTSSGNTTSISTLTSTTSALSALTGGKPSLFSRKSKRKDESKNSKNARLRSPLKEGIASTIIGGGAATANSLFYLNSNDLSSSATTPTGQLTTTVKGNGIGEHDANGGPLITSSLLKDKQRLADKIRELGLDFFSEDFEGITVSTTKCLSCETVTEQKETMIDIAVPVPQAGYESNECTNGRPNSFIQNSCITREYFRNENKYRCEQCTGYTEAIRSISYEVLPRLLVIQLSRFSGGMEKINSYIPTSFTLQCFCSKCCELSEGNKLHIYKLYSVITHVGATMSVGHYIAYTCSLDRANEYVNCPKDLKRRPSQERNTAKSTNNCGGLLGVTSANTTQNTGNSSTSNNSTSGSSTTSSGTSFMKKMKFGRSKASSSGDVTKNVKHLNGLIGGGVSKVLTNGIGKLSINSNNNANNSGNSNSNQTNNTLGNNNQSQQQQQMINTTCQGINCCAMRLCAQQQQQQQQHQQQLQTQHQASNSGSSSSDFGEDSSYPNGCGYGITGIASNNCNNNHHTHQHQHSHQQQQLQHSASGLTQTSGYGSIGRGGGIHKVNINNNNNINNCMTTSNGTEPIWYMCDDDKIKAMTQREFEELLSPTRKITITPYLLFYARFDLQPSQSKANCGINSMMTTSSSSSSTATTAATLITVGGNNATLHTNSYSTESLQSGGSGISVVGGIGNGSGVCSGNTLGTMGLRL